MMYDIAPLKRSVLAIYPFFGSVAAGVTYEETEEIRTTANDGKTLFYNPAYLAGLSADGQIFVLAHELCHIAFAHVQRGEGKDPEIWKAATDAVVNQMLKRDGLEIVPGGIDYPEAIDYDAEQFYEILLQHKLQIQLMGGSIDEQDRSVTEQSTDEWEQEDGDGDAGDGGESIDGQHSPWEDAAGRQPDEEPENGMDLFRELAEGQESVEEMEESEAPGQKQQDEEDLSEEEKALVARTVSRAGNAVSRDTRAVQAIGAAGPIIDWRAALRDTINYGVDWSFTNAVLDEGIVRPALEEQPMPETEIVLDTSWSVDEELLRRFLRECKNILLHSKVRAGCFDTVFYGFQDIRTEEDIEDMIFEGGGGTDFNVAVEAFTLRVDNRIIFTDGQAPVPDMPLDAIWMVYGDEKIEPEGGTVIHIALEQWG